MGGNQPANTSWINVAGTAAGTQVVMSHGGNFNTVIIGTTTTGTCAFYDTNVATGTASTNQIITYTGTARDSYPATHVRNGLVAVVSGTTNLMVSAG